MRCEYCAQCNLKFGSSERNLNVFKSETGKKFCVHDGSCTNSFEKAHPTHTISHTELQAREGEVIATLNEAMA